MATLAECPRFHNSIDLVMADSDSIDTISIDTENWLYTLTIDALNIE
jgi:hypothetical protein